MPSTFLTIAAATVTGVLGAALTIAQPPVSG